MIEVSRNVFVKTVERHKCSTVILCLVMYALYRTHSRNPRALMLLNVVLLSRRVNAVSVDKELLQADVDVSNRGYYREVYVNVSGQWAKMRVRQYHKL